MSRSARAIVGMITTGLVFGLNYGLFLAAIAVGACVYFSPKIRALGAKTFGSNSALHTKTADKSTFHITIHGNVGSVRRRVANEAIRINGPPLIVQPVTRWKAGLHSTGASGARVEIAIHAAVHHTRIPQGNIGNKLVITERDFLTSLLFAWESKAVVETMALLVRTNAIFMPCAVIYADTPVDDCAAVVRERMCSSGVTIAIPRLGELHRCHDILMEFYKNNGVPIVRISECLTISDALIMASNLSNTTNAQITESDVWQLASALKIQRVFDPL